MKCPHSNKAVADGAISFYLDHFVTTRVAKYTYGIPCNVPYDPSKPEHLSRASDCFTGPSGKIKVPGAFSTILKSVRFVLTTPLYYLFVTRE